MKKEAYFASCVSKDWPSLAELEPYFLGPPGQRWFFETGNDGGSFKALGVDGTSHLEENKGRVDLVLFMDGHPDFGVLLLYQKWGGGKVKSCASKGDLSRLREWVRTLHYDLRPVGLYIPFEEAWKAVKEFIETDGQLPKSIKWVDTIDLPEGTFPLQHEEVDGPIY